MRSLLMFSFLVMWVSSPSISAISLRHVVRGRDKSGGGPCSGFAALFGCAGGGGGGGGGEHHHTKPMSDAEAKASELFYKNPNLYCGETEKTCEGSLMVNGKHTYKCTWNEGKCKVVNPPYDWKGNQFPQKTIQKCKSIKKCEDIVGTDCGWCKKQGYARPGFSKQPWTEDPCDDWNFDSADCPANVALAKKQDDICKQVTTCAGIKGTSCGWCTKQGYARYGTWGGPSTQDPCNGWNFDSAACAPNLDVNQCAGITSCAGIAGTNCGWCKKQGYARPGTYQKPSTKDPCNKWIFYASEC